MFRLSAALALSLLASGAAHAHFGMLIPSSDVVLDQKSARVELVLSFSHPMEGNGMNMAKPKVFAVKDGDRTTDLLTTLKPAKVMEHAAWKSEYQFRKPGVGIFYFQPEPYFEPAEDKYIEHLTKVVVPAFGEEEGWDAPIGLAAEIVPLSRPFGNYAGNLFSGKLLVDGKPAADVEVEVEFYNQKHAYRAPNDYLVTQVVKTDANGVFHYAVPFAGWWGFAALTEAPGTLKHEGADKKVERGAVLWARFIEPARTRK